MKRYVIYLLGLMLVFSSCEKTVDYNIDDDIVKPVVYAFLSDSKAMVHLFWSSSYVSDNDEPEINDANIMLYEGDILLGAMAFVSDGVYELTGICPKPNVEYMITIDVPGYDGSIVAKTTMPAKVPADLHVTEDTICPEGEDTVFYRHNLSLVFDDPGGVSNYYSYKVEILMYLDGVEHRKDINIIGKYGLPAVGNQLMFTIVEYNNIMFNDKYIDGSRYEYDVNGLGDYSVNNPDYVYHDTLCTDCDLFDDMFFVVDSACLVPCFRTMNYDYYKFYCDAIGQSQASLNTSEAYYVYSNVENGYGIFAAYCEVSDTICVFRKEAGE